MSQTHFVDTDQGRISVRDTRAEAPAIVFIHGNSSSKEVFARQFDDSVLGAYRLVAFDLPGHGASDDARNPESAYSFGGYAEVAGQVLQSLGLFKPTLFGWSLGGHIGLEMIGRGVPVAGLMISGAPPVRPTMDSLMAGFNIDPNAENLTAKRDFTDEDAIAYATHTSSVDGELDPHLLAVCKRTDGRARELMFASVAGGQFLDEADIVREMTAPFAIVNGMDDPFIRADYFDSLAYGSLWQSGVVRVGGADHSPFLQQPDKFNALLGKFAGNA